MFGISPNTATFSVPFIVDRFVFFFGGSEFPMNRNYVHNCTFMLDTVTMTWTQPAISGTPPIARDMSASIVHGKSVFIFGGYAGHALRTFDELELAALPPAHVPEK